MTAPIGPLLLSYASSGIGVRGFDWEEDCLFQQGIVLELYLPFLNYSNTSLIPYRNTSLINDSLHKMTARVCVVCVCVHVCTGYSKVYLLLHTRQ